MQHTTHDIYTKESNPLYTQLIPIVLTVVVCGIVSLLYWGEIVLLNTFTVSDIVVHLRWSDIVIGMTIYLKTAIDFAMYIGNLIAEHPTYKDRIAVEIGSALGNALGTMAILVVWAFFKEVTWLLALMIVVAGCVLLQLAEESLEHTHSGKGSATSRMLGDRLARGLHRVNSVIAPFLRYVVPKVSMRQRSRSKTMWGLFIVSFSVPFILGLDDFAGYVSLFSIVNVFGFGIGVFVGHMLLNMALYISPRHTIAVVKNNWVALIGSIAFVAIAVWGFWEVIHMVL
jgi:hypothetical protein